MGLRATSAWLALVSALWLAACYTSPNDDPLPPGPDAHMAEAGLDAGADGGGDASAD